MIKGTYDELEPLIGRNDCGECGAAIEIAWDSDEKSWCIVCGNGHRPDSLKRILSESQEAKTQAQDELVGSRISPPETGQKTPAKYQVPEAVTMKGIPAADLGTGEILSPQVIHALITYAEKYGLDPVRGHVVMMYGKPYIGLDGYLYHANGTGIPYQLNSWPLDKGEREAMQVGENDHAWRADLTKPMTNESHIGIGIVTQEEMTEKSKKRPNQLASPVVAKHPWQLAQKRAEWQALRRAFPIGEEG